MLDYLDVEKIQTIKLNHLPNVNSLLIISLGLIFFTILSTALVYAETIPVNVEGNSFNVEYSTEQVVVNGVIAEYEPNDDYAGLIINVDVTGSPGILELILDRSFMDSIFDGLDDDYFVLVDGLEPNFTETTNTQSRTLNIEVPFGTEDIEIIGTMFGDGASTPVDDTPIVDTPVDDTPVDDTPVVDTPKTQCGPGTILKNGACVLDERCGPGTILKDGACIIDPTQSSGSTSKGMGKESIMGFFVAFAAAGIIAVVFGIIAKASKSS
jgi:hypothetical protein